MLKYVGLRPTGDLAGLTAYTSRRGKVVWFTKSPPLRPPSEFQQQQMLRFTAAALAWRGLTQEKRDAWNLACRRAGLFLHGYQLWVHWQLCRDRATIRTIERQADLSLLPP